MDDIAIFILINVDLKTLLIMRRLSKKFCQILTLRLRNLLWQLTRFDTDIMSEPQLFYLAKTQLIKNNVCAGNNSSFIITDDATDPSTLSQVYAFGDNKYGKLGLEDDDNHYGIIKKIYNIVQVCSNETQTLLLDDQGIVYTCGANFYGDLQPQLEWINKIFRNNKCSDDNYISLRIIEDLPPIIEISNNENCCAVLSKNGKVYIISSQLQDKGIISIPFLVTDLENIVHISLNDLFGLALDNNGMLYGFSLDIMGIINTPILIDEINVAQIYHDKLLLTNNKIKRLSLQNHKLLTSHFAVDKTDFINYNDYDNQVYPNNIVQIATGLYHTIYLTITGEVYVVGSNGYGQLGIGNINDRVDYPIKLNLSNIIKIAAGSYHSLFLTANEKVYACGRNDKKQIISSKYDIICFPKEVIY